MGCRPGCVWKYHPCGVQLRTPDDANFAAGRARGAGVAGPSDGVAVVCSGIAVVKVYVVDAAPCTCAALRTVTCSPGANGWSGVKIAPVPTRLLTSEPVCTPERLPVTRRGRNCAGSAPRNTIELCGAAVVQPGPGKASTADA